ncbi:MAG: ABC transporter permease subunit, partial [Actinomycetota bacterium]
MTSAGPYGWGEQPLSRTAASGLVLGMIGAAGAIQPSFAVPVGLLGAALSLRGLYESATGTRRGQRLARAGVAVGVLAALVSVLWAANRRGEIDLSGLGQAYFRRDIIEVMWPAFVRGAFRTIQLAALAGVAGVALGLVLAVFVISKSSWVRLPAKAYIDFFRGTPLLMQLLVISFGLPFIGIRLDPFPAGVIGLTLNSAAYVAEIFR